MSMEGGHLLRLTESRFYCNWILFVVIIETCTQIKEIKLLNANITHKTIDALIGLALKRPQIQFDHLFSHN
jgi:hypothetical protein